MCVRRSTAAVDLASSVSVELKKADLSRGRQQPIKAPDVLADENKTVEDGQRTKVVRVRLGSEAGRLEHDQCQSVSG